MRLRGCRWQRGLTWIIRVQRGALFVAVNCLLELASFKKCFGFFFQGRGAAVLDGGGSRGLFRAAHGGGDEVL